MKKLGFVILNYNDYDMTKRLIDNIKDYKTINKIVVVDNCSTDLSFKMLNEIKDITVIRTDKNGGVASGYNYGAKEIMKDDDDWIIVFSNADIIIKNEEDLKTLMDDINEEVKVVGPTIEELGTLNRGWKKSTPSMEILFNLPFISRYLKKKLSFYSDSYYQEDKSYVDVVSGCFFLVDGKALKKVDYLDENTFLYYEELILSSKIKNINKLEVVDNRVHIVHDHSVTIDKNVKRIKKYKILKTSQRYYVKNYLGANGLELFLLLLTNKLSLLILYVRCLFSK